MPGPPQHRKNAGNPTRARQQRTSQACTILDERASHSELLPRHIMSAHFSTGDYYSRTCQPTLPRYFPTLRGVTHLRESGNHEPGVGRPITVCRYRLFPAVLLFRLKVTFT